MIFGELDETRYLQLSMSEAEAKQQTRLQLDNRQGCKDFLLGECTILETERDASQGQFHEPNRSCAHAPAPSPAQFTQFVMIVAVVIA